MTGRVGPCWRQRSEQYLTASQSRSHFFRQVKGRPQHTHSLLGRSCLLRMRMGASDVERELVGAGRSQRFAVARAGGCGVFIAIGTSPGVPWHAFA